MTITAKALDREIDSDSPEGDELNVFIIKMEKGAHVVVVELPAEARVVALDCHSAAKLAHALSIHARQALTLNQEAGLAPADPPLIVLPRSH